MIFLKIALARVSTHHDFTVDEPHGLNYSLEYERTKVTCGFNLTIRII